MKKIYINESQLLELNIFGGETFIAGTDHPYFIDPNTEEEWSADWNGDYGFPFGFWDKAVYVPRERGGNGNLAQYHAMRYPYGENKNNEKKTIE